MKKFDMISLEEAGKMAIEEDCIVVDLRDEKIMMFLILKMQLICRMHH